MFILLLRLHLPASLYCSTCWTGPPPDHSHIKVCCNALFGHKRDLSPAAAELGSELDQTCLDLGFQAKRLACKIGRVKCPLSEPPGPPMTTCT